jgi:acyl phosphate:glycerol-3-phosphate acyltransferase
MAYVLAAIIGYLLGSVPVALLVARAHGVDLRTTGDGNPGAWNALEQLGPRRAWPAFAGDGAKAFLAALAGFALGDWWTGWVAVAAAMIGHALPLFASFRGGKSVMCFVGGAFALSPLAALCALGVAVVVSIASAFKYGARAGVFGFPVVQLAFDPVQRVWATGVLMGIIGALFALDAIKRRRSDRATPAPGAAPRP